jgi:hypothetical protein
MKDLVDILKNPFANDLDEEPLPDKEPYNDDWDCHASPADGCNCPKCNPRETE